MGRGLGGARARGEPARQGDATGRVVWCGARQVLQAHRGSARAAAQQSRDKGRAGAAHGDESAAKRWREDCGAKAAAGRWCDNGTAARRQDGGVVVE